MYLHIYIKSKYSSAGMYKYMYIPINQEYTDMRKYP